MVKQEIAIEAEQVVVNVRAHADLVIKGGETREFSVQGRSRHSFVVRQEGSTISISATDDCVIQLPSDSRIIVERVGGDAHISNLTGDLVCQKIGGNLILQQVGNIAIEQVGGDCQVVQVTGDLESHKVGSDFIGRDLQGATLIEKVGGDFLLQAAGGTVNSRAGGDIRVSLDKLQGGSTNLAAGGDIQVFVPSDAGLSIKVSSGGETIHLDLAGHTETIEEHYYETRIGDGLASLTLKAGGDVIITDRPWDDPILSDLGADFLEDQFHFQAFEDDWNSRIQDITQKTVNEATRRAEKRVQAALERIERRTNVFDPQHGGHPFFGIDIPLKSARPAAPPARPADPVSDDERMMILKMVESKKISVEEAEKLLQALEGK